MPRPNPGDRPAPESPVPLSPAAPPPHRYAAGYDSPAFSTAPNPFVVATPTAPPQPMARVLPRISELVHAFKRRWLLSTLLGGLVAAIAAVAVWTVLPSGKHEATAKVWVKTQSPMVTNKADEISDQEFDRIIERQKNLIYGKPFHNQVIADPRVSKLALVDAAEDKSRVIEGMLKVKQNSPEFLTIIMTGDNKDELKELLDVFVRSYIEAARADEMNTLRQSVSVMGDRLTKLREQLGQQRKASGGVVSGVEETSVKIGLVGKDVDSLASEIRVLSSQVESNRQRREQLLKQQAAKRPDVSKAEIDDALLQDKKVLDKIQAWKDATEQLKRNELRLQPGPLLDTYKKGVDDARQALEAEKAIVAEGVTDRLRADRLKTMDGDIKGVESKIEFDEKLIAAKRTEQEGKNRELIALKTQLEQLVATKGVIDPLDKEEKELARTFNDRNDQLTSWTKNQNDFSRFNLEAPKDPVHVEENANLKQKTVLAVVAGIASLLGIVLIIAYLEWRNRRVDGVEQVVTELGMRVIGTIPAFPSRAALRSGEAEKNQNWRFILNESVNSTRTMLLHTARTQQMQIIMVTSAMQGEGKTSLSSQLATSMATAGLRTLILDCDLRNPSMQKLFDIPVAPGCAEILLQEIDVSDAIQPTSVPNLWIIPAGQCNHRVIAALAQGHPMESLLHRVRGQFDIIVVDSCPILPVADTLLVAQHVDGVVFSILQDVSQLPKVQEASERLVQLNISLLGAVVNGIKPDNQAYGYNYVKQLPA